MKTSCAIRPHGGCPDCELPGNQGRLSSRISNCSPPFTARVEPPTDHAVRLSGLIAYEARIQAVRDWPFDQSTLIRVGAYVLIPTIPWVGEAIVSAAVQRLAH